MNRKPTSIRDLTLTVACVSHPELKPAHRSLLSTIAMFADHATGEHAHPGYEMLAATMQRSQETVRRYVRDLEDFGLLEVTKKPNGFGVATEWRVCLENPAYPDSYPTFKGPHDSVDQEKVRSTEKRLSSTNSQTLGPQKNDLAPQKAELAPQHSVDPPLSPSTATSTTAPATSSATIVARQLKELKRWMQRSNEDKNGTTLRARKEDWQNLVENLVDYGPTATRLAWKSFLEADDLPNNWKFPLIPFNEGFAGYLRRAESERASSALRDELWRYRQRLQYVFLQEVFTFKEFELTDAEERVRERHKEYLRRTRDGDPVKQIAGLDLSHAGDLERLAARADQWMKDNSKLVTRLQAERNAYYAGVTEDESDEETTQ